MNLEQARAALELLKQSESDRSTRRNADMEAHLDHADRTALMLAQLKLFSEDSPFAGVARAVAEAAKSGSPL